MAQAVLDGNRFEIDRVFDIIEATAKCQFCDYKCPNPRKVGFSGPPDIWDHIKEQHERESTWVNLGLLESTWVYLGLLGSTWVYLGLLGSS